jgi:hypothetical protein
MSKTATSAAMEWFDRDADNPSVRKLAVVIDKHTEKLKDTLDKLTTEEELKIFQELLDKRHADILRDDDMVTHIIPEECLEPLRIEVVAIESELFEHHPPVIVSGPVRPRYEFGSDNSTLYVRDVEIENDFWQHCAESAGQDPQVQKNIKEYSDRRSAVLDRVKELSIKYDVPVSYIATEVDPYGELQLQ